MANINTEGSGLERTGPIAEGAVSGYAMQARFQRIPDAHLNMETVAGIRDMKLGRIRNGRRIGAPTVRFDRGRSSAPHINIDPSGRPGSSNPHIYVSEGTINTVETINKTLKYAGITLIVVAVAIDAWRAFTALQEDYYYIQYHADETILELDKAISILKRKMPSERSFHVRQSIWYTIEYLERILNDVMRTKTIPVNFLRTVSSAAGGWSAGAAGGAGGAWAGAQTGALLGLSFGPAGAAIGAPIGAFVGAIGGGIAGGSTGSYLGHFLADKTIETFFD